MTLHRNTLLFLAVLIIGLSLLAPTLKVDYPCSQDWTYADLAAIDPTDAANPEDDIVALYGRMCEGELEIRLDFLQGTASNSNLQLTLMTPTGDWIVNLPAGNPISSAGEPDLPAHITSTQHPQLDSIVIRIDHRRLPKRLDQLSVTAVTKHADSVDFLDQAGPARLGGSPPSPAPLLLVFKNTFSAATPADALRSWNGAHIGPLGQRHGLAHLLLAASEHNIPLALLDLKTSEALSALDSVGGLPLIRQMVKQGLLILPDTATGDPETASVALEFSREAAAWFGLRASRTAYHPLLLCSIDRYDAAFSSYVPPDHISQSNGFHLIPLPAQSLEQPGSDYGLTIEGELTLQTLRKLLDSALSEDPSDLVTLGGSLPTSLWADVYAAPAIMAYLAGHPWINLLDTAELSAFPTHENIIALPRGCRELPCSASGQPIIPSTTTGQPFPENLNQFDLQGMLRNDLFQLKSEKLAAPAWHSYLQLTHPSKDLQHQALQANNLDTTAHLVAAAHWAANPQPIFTCSTDLDYDGLPECQLASKTIYAAFELDGGRLALLVFNDGSQISQVIASTGQYAVGLSDPREWQLEYGSAADPEAILGAFSTLQPPFPVFTADFGADYLSLIDPTGSIRKKFSLRPDGLLVEISDPINQPTRIPLLLTGGLPPEPGWAEDLKTNWEFSASHIQWQLPNGQTMQVTVSDTSFTTSAFLDSLDFMTSPEDPNYFYTPGHQLPYPFAVAEVESTEPYLVRFQISP